MMDDGGMGGMGMMWIFGLLLLVGVIVLVVVLVKAFTDRPSNTGGTGAGRGAGAGSVRGREILAERLAQGEITSEEYRERLRALEEDGR